MVIAQPIEVLIQRSVAILCEYVSHVNHMGVCVYILKYIRHMY